MRAFVCSAILLCAVPALASDAKPAAPSSPAAVTYSVWTFKLTDGKWAKNEQYSWTTPDPAAGLEYARKVNAVPGWCATTNCPAPAAAGYAAGRGFHRGSIYANANRGFAFTVNGRTIYLPSMNQMIQAAGSAEGSANSSDTFDVTPTYDNSQAIQDSINIQNMINTQNMINNQMMQNNIQDMINTQNAVNTQNMIDAQNAANAQMNNP